MAHFPTQNPPFWNGNFLAPSDEEIALGILKIMLVGGGGYSDVWKASMPKDGATVLVALKEYRMLTSDTQDRLRKREARESVWRTLFHNKNVAPLYAIYHTPRNLPVFVSPWCENGTADIYLRNHPNVNPIPIIYEIACGLEYLHGKGVTHGDFKGQNVLIDDGGHARIIDFGLSHFTDQWAGLTTTTPTTFRWCPRELFVDNGRPTMVSDVYSFASTALQLLTGRVPYSTAPTDAIVLTRIINGVTPRDEPIVFEYNVPRPAELLDLLGWCWDAPLTRPNIREVRLRLARFHA